MSVLRRFAHRVRSALPGDIESAFVAAVRSFEGKPVVTPPPVGRTLVLAPHPDDEVILAGGTITLSTAMGHDVLVVGVTDGSSGGDKNISTEEVARRRLEEQRRAADLLGVSDVVYLGLPDGGLYNHAYELERSIGQYLSEFAPAHVMTPWWLDGHEDHRSVARAVAQVVSDDHTVWAGEVWTPAPINRIVDVTSVFSAKQRAIGLFKTANEALDLQSLIALDRFRSAFGLGGVGYAEGFRVGSGKAFRRWTLEETP